MEHCQCEEHSILTGQEAEQYSKKEYMREVQRASGGWRYLLKCEICNSYWEMYWEGGGGFDDGVMMLRQLSPSALRDRWPEYKPE